MSTEYTTYLNSPIGYLEIRGTMTVISSISFENEPGQDSANLPPNMIECARQLDEYFRGVRTTFKLNAEQKGTPFQQVVWKQLRHIPYGRTNTYLDIARLIADDRLVRAVGSANGRNKLSIVVPCHRVIGVDGTLVGYAGELWRKDWLLKHEARFALGVQSLFG